MKCSITLVALFIASLGADARGVNWAVDGVVESAWGSIEVLGVARDDLVAVEIAYDDAAPVSDVEMNTAETQVFKYREDIALTVSVTIGAHTWTGSLESGTTPWFPITLSNTNAIPFTEDRMTIDIGGLVGGEFTSFPGADPGDDREIVVLFVDQQVGGDPPDFLNSADLPAAANSPALMDPSRLFIIAGASGVQILIDPATFVITHEVLPRIENFQVSSDAGALSASWDSVVGKCYLLQWSEDLENWFPLVTVEAEAPSTTQAIAPVGGRPKQFYRVMELE